MFYRVKAVARQEVVSGLDLCGMPELTAPALFRVPKLNEHY